MSLERRGVSMPIVELCERTENLQPYCAMLALKQMHSTEDGRFAGGISGVRPDHRLGDRSERDLLSSLPWPLSCRLQRGTTRLPPAQISDGKSPGFYA